MARLSHAASSERNAEASLKKGPWTAAEDAMLMEYVRRQGGGNWNAVRKSTGLARCGKSCRLRWANHLRPNLKKGAFSPDEEQIIIDLHANLGNKWARMASQLPGRTDNEIKNYWNTRLKRRQRSGLPIYPNAQHQQLLNQTSQYSHHHHLNSHNMKPMTHHDPRALSHHSNFSLSLMPQISTPNQMINNDPYTFQYYGHFPGTLSSMLTAPELPSSQTPPASDGGNGGITYHGYNFAETSRFAKSGLLGDLVVEGQAVFWNTKSNENEASLLVDNEEGDEESCTFRSPRLTFNFADTESTESTTDNFSSCVQSSIGGRMEPGDDRIDASSNMDDDLMSLLNVFPASSIVPEYPDRYCRVGGSVQLMTEASPSSVTLISSNTSQNALTTGNRSDRSIGSQRWNNMPSIH